MEAIMTPQPHFIPGYAGYCPQYTWRIGNTFGSTTHKILLDPNIGCYENSRLANCCTDDYHVKKPTFCEIDLIKQHERRGDPVYTFPMIPGYEGFIPYASSKVGHRFTNAATMGIAEYEKNIQEKERKKRFMRHKSALEEKNVFNRSVGERSLGPDYRLPLETVRPEVSGIVKKSNQATPIPPSLPYSKDTPPHFMKADDKEKYIKSNYAGSVPFSADKNGMTNLEQTKSALTDFVNDYHFRRTTEWAPVKSIGVAPPKPKLCCQFEIYLRNSGLIPNYAGHVPGVQFSVGERFGKNTFDAKQNLSQNKSACIYC